MTYKVSSVFIRDILYSSVFMQLEFALSFVEEMRLVGGDGEPLGVVG